MKKIISPDEKARIVLEALRGERTINQISGLFQVHPTQINNWKKIARDGLPRLFSDKRSKENKNQEELISQSSIVGSRDVINVIREKIAHSPAEVVYLDFAKVTFVSRSAAHEFLLVQEAMHQTGKQLSFSNTNSDVAEMIRVVAANRALPQRPKPQFKPEKVDAHSLLGV